MSELERWNARIHQLLYRLMDRIDWMNGCVGEWLRVLTDTSPLDGWMDLKEGRMDG